MITVLRYIVDLPHESVTDSWQVPFGRAILTCVLVAVEDVEVYVLHKSQELTHTSLAAACLSHQQHRLLMTQAPGTKPSHKHVMP